MGPLFSLQSLSHWECHPIGVPWICQLTASFHEYFFGMTPIYLKKNRWANSNITIYLPLQIYKTTFFQQRFLNDHQPRHPFLNGSSFRLKSLNLFRASSLKFMQNSPPKKLPLASIGIQVFSKNKSPQIWLNETWYTMVGVCKFKEIQPKMTNPRGTCFFHLFFPRFPSKGNKFGILSHSAALRHHSTLKELVLVVKMVSQIVG